MVLRGNAIQTTMAATINTSLANQSLGLNSIKAIDWLLIWFHRQPWSLLTTMLFWQPCWLLIVLAAIFVYMVFTLKMITQPWLCCKRTVLTAMIVYMVFPHKDKYTAFDVVANVCGGHIGRGEGLEPACIQVHVHSVSWNFLKLSLILTGACVLLAGACVRTISGASASYA